MREDMFGPFNASVRNHLGEFADVWMQAKIELLQKLSRRISAEIDPVKLEELRKELNDAFTSEDDLTNLDQKLIKLLDLMEKNVTRFITVQNLLQKKYKD